MKAFLQTCSTEWLRNNLRIIKRAPGGTSKKVFPRERAMFFVWNLLPMLPSSVIVESVILRLIETPGTSDSSWRNRFIRELVNALPEKDREKASIQEAYKKSEDNENQRR